MSCVKNEPFVKPYIVPDVYTEESLDSSALARVIMMEGIGNYLNTGASAQLSNAEMDSLWNNKGNPFTPAIVSNFLYSAELLNKMKAVNFINISDADSIKAFADSTVFYSQHFNDVASNGVAGTKTVGTSKRLFSEKGVEYSEVWYHAMLGAMAFNSAKGNMISSGTSVPLAWDLAYRYIGFPGNYDIAIDYTALPLKSDRPLGIAALFSGAESIDAAAIVYEEFRRAKVSAVSSNSAVAVTSLNTIKETIEKTFALTALSHIDALKQSNDEAARLHYLSQVYGLIWALKYFDEVSPLSVEDYHQLRNIFRTDFYSIINEAGLVKVNQLQTILKEAYSL